MHDFLDKVEATGIATWVRESPSILAFTTVLSLHAMGLAIVAGLNVVVALRLLGAVKALPLVSLRGLFPAMWVGFWINVFSGVLLLMADANNMLVLTIFYFKMGFIVLGALNLRYMQKKVFTNEPMLASGIPDGQALATAWLSILFWGGALVCGRLTAYPGLITHLLGL